VHPAPGFLYDRSFPSSVAQSNPQTPQELIDAAFLRGSQCHSPPPIDPPPDKNTQEHEQQGVHHDDERDWHIPQDLPRDLVVHVVG